MTSLLRSIAGLWCAVLCVLAGCCTTKPACSTSTACVASAVVLDTSTYENYTPPQPVMKPIPVPETPPPPSEDVPPPPMTHSEPGPAVDYFESAQELPQRSHNR